jgi:P27 family predicted phage terminase small subunit
LLEVFVKKGRKRKPTAIKKLEGNPGHRPLNRDESKILAGAVVGRPRWLTETAQGEWRRIMSALRKTPGLLTTCDRAVLAAYCQAWARWREAEEAVGTGLTVRVDLAHGYHIRQLNAAVRASKIYFDEMMRAASMLGFSPSDRSGVHPVEPFVPKQMWPEELTPPPWSAPHMLVEGHRKRKRWRPTILSRLI